MPRPGANAGLQMIEAADVEVMVVPTKRIRPVRRLKKTGSARSVTGTVCPAGQITSLLHNPVKPFRKT